MFRLTPEDAARLLTEWLTENAPEIAERGMRVTFPQHLFASPWPSWPTAAEVTS